MNTISRIISENGGMDALRNGERLRVVNRAGADLEIEYVAIAANGDLVCVSQHDPQGTLHAAMHFEVDEFGWVPCSFLDVSSQKESHVFTVSGTEVQLFGINLELQRRLEKLAQQWDQKLKQQGFIEADEQNKYYPLFNEELFAV